MKLAILIVLLFATSALAVDFTYEVVENELKITATETTTDTQEETSTIEALEVQIATLEVSKVNTLTYYNDNIARLDGEIAVIQAHIDKATELGLAKEVIELK